MAACAALAADFALQRRTLGAMIDTRFEGRIVARHANGYARVRGSTFTDMILNPSDGAGVDGVRWSKHDRFTIGTAAGHDPRARRTR